jgi:hypothetical protein
MHRWIFFAAVAAWGLDVSIELLTDQLDHTKITDD